MKPTLYIFLVCLFLTNVYSQCYTNVKTSQYSTIARRNDGTLWTKGPNQFGICGNGTNVPIAEYTQIGDSDYWSDKFAIKSNHAIAIKKDGTLWAWGSNNLGVLGIGVPNAPGYLPPTQVGTDNSWTNVAAGWKNSFGIKSDGTLWAWGRNDGGMLGVGDLDNNRMELSPIQVGTATDWLKVFASDWMAFAIKADGTLWSWGSQGAFLGYSYSGNSNRTPHQVGTATDWQTISCAFMVALGIKTNHTLWVWGSSGTSQFGDGTPNPQPSFSAVPIQLGTDNDWSQISTATNQCLALKTNGTRWGWGNNYNALGNGQMSNLNYPTQLDNDSDWIFVDVSNDNGVGNAIKQNHALYRWGDDQVNVVTIPVPTIEGSGCNLATEDFVEGVNVNVFPNPATDKTTVAFDLTEPLSVYIAVVNDLGQLVWSETIEGTANTNEHQIDTRKFASGMYLIQLAAGNKVFNAKFIKN